MNNITTTVTLDGKIYSFTIQRLENGELDLLVSGDIPIEIKLLIDDLWVGHASSTI